MALIEIEQPTEPTGTSDLIKASTCINSCIPVGMQLPVLIYLLQQMAGNAMSTDELMQEAACYRTCIPPGMLKPVVIYLLDQIAQQLAEQ